MILTIILIALNIVELALIVTMLKTRHQGEVKSELAAAIPEKKIFHKSPQNKKGAIFMPTPDVEEIRQEIIRARAEQGLDTPIGLLQDENER